jgi:N-acyl-D-aspartate/D-glutamate deacylase
MRLCVLFGLLAFSVACDQGERFDIVIRGGTVIDGMGTPPTRADIGIRGDRIAKVGDLTNAVGTDLVDATGLIVSPGFIDVHSHTAEAIGTPERKLNEGVVRQGVTTIVGGPDGQLSPETIQKLIAAYQANGVGTNVAFYVGHNAIRREVMKESQRRAPTDVELTEMRRRVKEGMELGAVGFSTGLMYEPGLFSTTDEVAALAREVAPFGGTYDSHVRDPGHDLIGSDTEVVEVARRAGIRGRIAHEKVVGLENAGLIEEVITLVTNARASGVDITSDQYPYDGAATGTLENLVVVPEELQQQPGFDLRVALKDPRVRAQLKETSEQGIDGGFAWLKATGYSQMRIVSAPSAPALVGRYLSQLAEEQRKPGFDLVADLLVAHTEPIRVTFGAILEPDVRRLMVQPWNMIASDGGYVEPGERRGHPRGAGTFVRVLGRYVREWQVLTLEDAVKKMTRLPAQSVGLSDRGRLVAGMAADIAIFDAKTVIDRSTWDDPHRYAEGVPHVLVNGVWVLKDGKMTGQAPGKFVRPRTGT